MTTQLPPCPFCGGPAKLVASDYVDDYGRDLPFAECEPCEFGAPIRSWMMRPQVSPQPGWKLVPTELTEDMLVAFAETWYSKRQTIDDPDMADAYADMLAVAPEPTFVQPKAWYTVSAHPVLGDVISVAFNRENVTSSHHALYETLEPIEVPVDQAIDLDKLDWEQVLTAARESKWMPPKYTRNDWLADICRYLRDGTTTQTVGQLLCGGCGWRSVLV